MLGLPYVGKVFYVDPSAGNDANSGTGQNKALATVAAAYAKCTSGKHDVVIIAPTGGTGRTTETAAITWAKRFTHLVGSAAPSQLDIRAGMSFSSAVVSPCFTISENGCIFKNLTIAVFEDINVLVKVTGEYNYFSNVHFIGIGNTTTGDDTAGRSVVLDGASENLFEGCTIGVDTVTRSVANSSLELTGVSARNIFRSCLFPAFTDNAGVLFVDITANDGVQRFVIFENCLFLNADVSSSTTMTVGIKVFSANLNGTVVLKDSYMKGATDWASGFAQLFLTMPLTDTDEGGLMKIGT